MSWIRENTLNWFHILSMKIISTFPLPKHIAFIMDGNRRYANKQQVAKVEGHSRGFEKMASVLYWCMKLGITQITIYAFSIENFKRTKEEVDGLMELATEKFKHLLDETDKLMEYGICVRIIGNLSLIPEDLQLLIAKAMVMTKSNNKVYLNIAFAYTSRDEITHAIKSIVEGAKHNEILQEDIDEQLISNCLYTYHCLNPDLLIRTSGEVRLSDFLMWQTSNTCIYFTPVLWPEFSIWDFLGAIFYYQRCYPDLQKSLKPTKNLKSIAQNDRISIFINKLHHKHQVMIENMCLPTIQS